MAYALGLWFAGLLVAYAAFAAAKKMRRARAMALHLVQVELSSLRPTNDSALPACPNDYIQPAIYSDVV
jgi:hypothetical protein